MLYSELVMNLVEVENAIAEMTSRPAYTEYLWKKSYAVGYTYASVFMPDGTLSCDIARLRSEMLGKKPEEEVSHDHLTIFRRIEEARKALAEDSIRAVSRHPTLRQKPHIPMTEESLRTVGTGSSSSNHTLTPREETEPPPLSLYERRTGRGTPPLDPSLLPKSEKDTKPPPGTRHS